MTDARWYYMANHKVMYYVVMFASFMIAIKLIPWFEGLVVQYLPDNLNILQPVLPFVLAYVAAIFIIPEVVFMIIKSASEE